MATLVAGEVVGYGSTQQEKLLVVLSAMMDHNQTNSKHPSNPASWKTWKVVCAMMVVTEIPVGVLLLMTGPSKIMLNIRTRNVDGISVVSSYPPTTECAPATGTFSGLSCKDSYGFCAGPGSSFGARTMILPTIDVGHDRTP